MANNDITTRLYIQLSLVVFIFPSVFQISFKIMSSFHKLHLVLKPDELIICQINTFFQTDALFKSFFVKKYTSLLHLLI